MTRRVAMLGAALLLVAGAAPQPSLKLADSFRIGNAGVLCSAQARTADPVLTAMFDRGYQIVCRDAATAVGSLYALRISAEDPAARLVARRPVGEQCDAPVDAGLADLPGAKLTRCRRDGLGYDRYVFGSRTTLYAAEGLAGYGSALQLGLRALVADHGVAGEVKVAATEAGDPAAFARVQAGSLDPAQALTEGYSRNSASSFAEASAFFDNLAERAGQGDAGATRNAEYLANQALQQSNLGNFAEADALLVRASRAADPSDPLIVRMMRNFRAMHELNRRRPDAALAELRRSGGLGAEQGKGRLGDGYIDVPIAQQLNSDSDALTRLGGTDGRLTVPERAAILDAQGEYLQGAVLRMKGDVAASRARLDAAIAHLDAVREGRVASNAALKAAVLYERSALAERAGDAAGARADLVAAEALFAANYPGTATLLAARARLAGLLARQGDKPAALAMFKAVVADSPGTPGASQVVRPLMQPYFALLADGGDTAADFFAASQTLARPGVAQTQAVLARELSGGSDAAAGLFRQSVTLSRDLVRLDAELAALTARPDADPAAVAALKAKRATLGRDQTAVLAQLSDNPRYRVIADGTVTLAELQAKLKPREGYYKLVLVGDDAYALLATAGTARVFRVGATTAGLGTAVATLRDSIVTFENGRATTYAFDVATARQLYLALFAPAEADLPGIGHLIFEPDGPLLQLPVNLLVATQASADAYAKRAATSEEAAFDFTGIDWLGRDRMVSTVVSPRAFLDVRAIAPSRARRPYLGLGENAPPPPLQLASRAACDWPASEWQKPISAAELRLGAAASGAGSEVLTGPAFTDTALAGRGDLRDFRVLHFATHGLVTAPRPECPARPALLTSFGGTGSDGLLSFREIFDLRLDADTVILSACDTAGSATLSATREAGIATGGNFALDGLVRAFVGAGARAVVASHWPVPDDYDATKILITGLFADEGRTSVGEALRASQRRLMDRKETSHPYYWAGFAIIGDATKPLSGGGTAGTVTAAR